MNETATMRAIIISKYGGPEVLVEERRPVAVASPGFVVVRVKAFGVNHAEAFFRRGVWGDVAQVTGIECVGEVHDPSDSHLCKGQRVFALMGGMGRSINGSYAEFVAVPAAHVVPVQSALSWTDLAALPESYATAWVFLRHNLEVGAGDVVVVRGGTSALGQAAINIARGLDVRVIATTRLADKVPLLLALGAEVLMDGPNLSEQVRERIPAGADAVLDIVGTTTLLDSFKMVRYRGRVALAGFLGGFAPLTLDPLIHLPSGLQFSFFGSAFAFGTSHLPLSAIPFAEFVSDAERGSYRASPAHVFGFEEIVDAHRLMESGQARGKIVVTGAE